MILQQAQFKQEHVYSPLLKAHILSLKSAEVLLPPQKMKGHVVASKCMVFIESSMPGLQVQTTEKSSEAASTLSNRSSQQEWVRGMKQLLTSPHIYSAGDSFFFFFFPWTRFCLVLWRNSSPVVCGLKLSMALVDGLDSCVPPASGNTPGASRLLPPKDICWNCTQTAPPCGKLTAGEISSEKH